MSHRSPLRIFRTSPEIIRLAVILYVRFPPSLTTVDVLLHLSGIDVIHETVRYWWHRFGPKFAAEIRKQRIAAMRPSRWRRHVDEMFVKTNWKRCYFWPGIDHEGEILASFVTKTRDQRTASKFLKNAMKRLVPPQIFVTDRLRSNRAALKEIGTGDWRDPGCWKNNRADNSHQPLLRRERPMQRFRPMRSRQMFAAVRASVSNHFNYDRSLSSRTLFKQNRGAALAESCGCSTQETASLSLCRSDRVRLTAPFGAFVRRACSVLPDGLTPELMQRYGTSTPTATGRAGSAP